MKPIVLLLPLLVPGLGLAEEWTRFRGPNGSGIASGPAFPSRFSRQQNMLWRAAARPGKSSPVLTEKHVFLTGFAENKLFTQCFDRTTGRLVWEAAEERPRDEPGNALNHPAAITPVTDGENVYVFFKDYGLLSYGPAGQLRWKTPLGPFANSMGLGASPILSGDTVIVVADQLEGSFIAAFDTRNGETRWRTNREEGESWATPVLYQPSDGPARILTTGRSLFGVHSAADGKRLGGMDGISPATVASPVVDGDVLYQFGYGDDSAPPFSTRLEKLDKDGDGRLSAAEFGNDAFLRSIARYGGDRDGFVTAGEWDERRKTVLGHNGVTAVGLEGAEPRARWKLKKSVTGVIPSPLLYDGILYIVRNGGILMSIDAAEGKIRKEARVEGALGGFSASPVAAAGHILLVSEDGHAAVVKAGAEWESIAVNDLDEAVFATPALSDGKIFLRTSEALYCFGAR